MTGRARGRGRGRARGAATDVAEPVRRPGDQAPRPTPSEEAQQAQVAAPLGAGRASHRGGTRQEPRPGGVEAAAVTQQIAGLKIEGDRPRRGPPTQGRHERMEHLYIEPKTKPTHIDSKLGSNGRKLGLMCNYFKLESRPNWALYQYHVSFAPEVDSKRMRLAMLKDHKELLGETNAFDGMVLFSGNKLAENPTEVYSVRKYDDEKIKITIKLTNELPPDSPTTMHMYNVIFRRILNMIKMKQIGRHYYDPSSAVMVERHGLEIWPGFITSIMQMEDQILLCAEISHKILRIQSVLDVMKQIYQNSRDFHRDCSQKLIGQIVITRYNNKTYRIDDIAWEKHPSDTFPLRNGEDTSFVDYYNQHYQVQISDASQQPMLISNPKKKDIRGGRDEPILLVPELCFLTGLSDEVKADFNVMKDLAVHTRVTPDARVRSLNAFIERISGNEEVSKELKGWGLRFSKQLVQFEGRTLDPEMIIQKDRNGQNIVKFGYKPFKAEWPGEMRDKQLLNCIPMENWVLIVTERDAQNAQQFCQTLSRVAPPMGMKVGRPSVVMIPDGRAATYVRAIEQNMNEQVQLVCCIVPSNKKDCYDAIKKLCCISRPVPSQVIVSRTLSKPKTIMSVATKIAIQLNCKLGGEVWGVEMPLKGLMVVGIDCYHDSGTKGRSVGGVIASMNQNLTQYYSRCTFQHNHGELMNQLKVCLTGALKEFHRRNNALPVRIIIYRDGVGDGQLPAVVEHEIPQLLECFRDVGSDYQPKVAVVVVKKRINSRFFADAGRGQLSNPPPGTIIDNTVTKPEWYDFFLVSQSVNQGTVTPTHYNVIWDTLNIGPDKMQRLTYKLCHLYYNWPGTIRVPAPCQYAHKLAFLVGQSLHEDPSLELADKLFYL